MSSYIDRYSYASGADGATNLSVGNANVDFFTKKAQYIAENGFRLNTYSRDSTYQSAADVADCILTYNDNTGVFTATRSGVYRFTMKDDFVSGANNSGKSLDFRVGFMPLTRDTFFFSLQTVGWSDDRDQSNLQTYRNDYGKDSGYKKGPVWLHWGMLSNDYKPHPHMFMSTGQVYLNANDQFSIGIHCTTNVTLSTTCFLISEFLYQLPDTLSITIASS